jgi:hypothetical protein
MKRLLSYAAGFAAAIFVLAGCPQPSSGGKSSGDTVVTFNSLIADGSQTTATTKLILIFDKDITGLTAADITLTSNSTGAVKGTLTKTGTGTYDLSLTGITTSGMIIVSVTKSGYTISGNQKVVTVYGSAGTSVTFNNLIADGSVRATTTKLTLYFDQDITNLAVADITLSAGITGAMKGTLTRTGTGTYDLLLTGIIASGGVTVSVAKSGYTISGGEKAATVYYYSGGAVTSASFNSLIADGSAWATTTKLTLYFDKDITGLEAGNIALNAGTTGASKNFLTRTGTGTYDLFLTGITASGSVTVSVVKSGYDISGGEKTAAVYYYNGGILTDVSFISLIADGSAQATTTKLTLYFDQDITNFTEADIILSGGTGATKGVLTRTGIGTYDLSLTGITTSGSVTVSVVKSGYNISTSKMVSVFYYSLYDGTLNFTINFTQIADDAPSITGPTIYRYSSSDTRPAAATLSVTNPSQYTSIAWRVQDTDVTGNGTSFTLSANNPLYNTIATHFVTVTVTKGGIRYNKTVTFTIEY